jgi:hypothetical protein
MNFFINLSNWVNQSVAAVFGAVLAVAGVYLFIKRKLLLAIAFLLGAGVSAAFIFSGTTIAQKLGDWFVKLLS